MSWNRLTAHDAWGIHGTFNAVERCLVLHVFYRSLTLFWILWVSQVPWNNTVWVHHGLRFTWSGTITSIPEGEEKFAFLLCLLVTIFTGIPILVCLVLIVLWFNSSLCSCKFFHLLHHEFGSVLG